MMDFTPKDLFSRFLLIILIPIFLLLVISAYIFYERHWENVSNRMQESLINEIMLLVEIEKKSPSLFASASSSLNFESEVIPGGEVSELIKNHLPITDSELELYNQSLAMKLGKRTLSYYLAHNSRIKTYIELDNKVVAFSFSNKKIHSPTTMVFILWMVGTAVLLVTISITFMKNQVRAIANLAIAAERLGKGQEIGNFRPSGASEVKIAGKAFLRMKDRIERQITYRTELLAHISHDLRTPLTRLKLQIALLKEKNPAAGMEADIAEMEKLIEGYLTFAKEEGNEVASKFNIIAGILEVAQKFNDNRIKLNLPKAPYIVTLKREALNRVISNLVSNAIKYCKKQVEISFYKTATHFYITVDDDGKGIPEDKFNAVFDPFIKLDSKSDGFGLGLAIVKNIVYSHGGKVMLYKSALGGLKVSVRFPT
jgi:two-component system osmolarity sensor histidine kinase EnvZ